MMTTTIETIVTLNTEQKLTKKQIAEKLNMSVKKLTSMLKENGVKLVNHDQVNPINSLKKEAKNMDCTYIELAVSKMLDDLNVNYEQEKVIKVPSEAFSGKKIVNPDFMVKGIAIECQGSYYHADPKMYGNDKKPLNKTQKEVVANDMKKFETYKKMNIPYIQIWESELNESLDNVKHQLELILK